MRLGSRTIHLLPMLFLGLSILGSRIPASAQAAHPPPPACWYLLNDPRFLPLLRDPAQSVPCLWELAIHDRPTLNDPLSRGLRTALRTAAAAPKSISTIQTGSPTGSAGTTSAVSKPNTLTSLATEYGGITSSTSNQTVTLQTTLDGIPRAIVDHGRLPYCWSELIEIKGCSTAHTLDFLNRFGLGVTANTSTPSQNLKGTATGPATGSAQQVSFSSSGKSEPSLSSLFAKYTFKRAKYQLPSSSPPSGVDTAQHAILKVIDEDMPESTKTEYRTWQECVGRRFGDKSFQKLDDPAKYQVFARYYSQIVGIFFENKSASCSDTAPVIELTPQLPASLSSWQKSLITAMDDYMAAVSVFEANFDQSMLAKLAQPVVAAEYDYNRPQNQPTNSTVKLVVSLPFGGSRCLAKTLASKPGTLTLNAGASLYNSTPASSIPGASILRDIQAGAEVDWAVCTSRWLGSWFGNSTLALAYYYQDQTSPSILNVTPGTPLTGISFTGLSSSATQVFTKKGPINLAQFKYGWGVGKNVSFPIAVTWSNRTQLITHAIWGVQFGVSYDLSSLFNSGTAAAGTAK